MIDEHEPASISISRDAITAQIRPMFDALLNHQSHQRQKRHHTLGLPCVLDLQLQTMGFCLHKYPSSIPEAGHGVKVLRGHVQRGQIVALYPGSVYEPGDPILLQSIRNCFILKRKDGTMIDANDRPFSLSRLIAASIVNREGTALLPVSEKLNPDNRNRYSDNDGGGGLQSYALADRSWLNFYSHSRKKVKVELDPLLYIRDDHERYPVTNPLSIGHYVNGSNNTGSALQYLRRRGRRELLHWLLGNSTEKPVPRPVDVDDDSNVTYMEYEFVVQGDGWDTEHMQFIPNVHYRPRSSTASKDDPNSTSIKSTVLVALRDITQGEELLASYVSSAGL